MMASVVPDGPGAAPFASLFPASRSSWGGIHATFGASVGSSKEIGKDGCRFCN